MPIVLLKTFDKKDHWASEFYSGILLISVGIYGFFISDSNIIQKSFIDGYLLYLPNNLWQMLFLIVGLLQILSLRLNKLFLRGLASFLSCVMLIWGSLNIAVYGNFHFSLIAWVLFSIINLHAFVKILQESKREIIKYVN